MTFAHGNHVPRKPFPGVPFGGMVVIGFNDTSVRFIKLKREGQFLVFPENPLHYRPPGFEEGFEVADIEEKK